MTDRKNEKMPVPEMTQLEAMELIKEELHMSLRHLACASQTYKRILSERRFAHKEITQLQTSYTDIVGVWASTKRRLERERRKKGEQ